MELALGSVSPRSADDAARSEATEPPTTPRGRSRDQVGSPLRINKSRSEQRLKNAPTSPRAVSSATSN